MDGLWKGVEHWATYNIYQSTLMGNVFCQLSITNANFQKFGPFPVCLELKLLYYWKKKEKIMRPAAL